MTSNKQSIFLVTTLDNIKIPKTLAGSRRVQLESSGRAGRWTKDECRRFEEALEKFGDQWKKVETYVGTRSGTQIRSHAQKYFLRLKQQKRALTQKVDLSIDHTSIHTSQERKTQTEQPNDIQNIFKPFKTQEDNLKFPSLNEILKNDHRYLLGSMRGLGHNNTGEICERYIKLSDWVDMKNG